jgi:hypothetical protein
MKLHANALKVALVAGALLGTTAIAQNFSVREFRGPEIRINLAPRIEVPNVNPLQMVGGGPPPIEIRPENEHHATICTTDIVRVSEGWWQNWYDSQGNLHRYYHPARDEAVKTCG